MDFSTCSATITLTDAQAEEMEALEVKVLAALGVARSLRESASERRRSGLISKPMPDTDAPSRSDF